MKEMFHTSLTGGKWWKPFLAMIVLMVLTLGAYEFSLFRIDENSSPRLIAASFLFAFVMLLGYIVIATVFAVVLMRIGAAAVTFRDKPFSFDGQILPLTKLVLGGTLLTLITLGFYGPWFYRRYVSYLTDHTAYDGERPRFLGKGGKLLKYSLLSLVLPLTVLLIVFGVSVAVMAAGGNAYGPEYSLKVGLATLIFEVVLFFAIIPYEYLMYRWLMNFNWKNRLITWNTDFWSSVGFLVGQLALTIITVGIYWPAFLLRSAKYFTGKTVITEDARELARFDLQVPLLRGFLYIWGQTLLTIVTLGIFLPWSYANIVRFLVNGVSLNTAE